MTWSFTTGAPQTTLSNQIAFLSERGGVANLWAMNPDGTAPRQLSTELTPILDYAVAPDGSSFVVGDGRRLVFALASGADRRVLTEDGFVEFDPTYSPNGQRIAFGRADAATGDGLGLWERTVDGGDVDADRAGRGGAGDARRIGDGRRRGARGMAARPALRAGRRDAGVRGPHRLGRDRRPGHGRGRPRRLRGPRPAGLAPGWVRRPAHRSSPRPAADRSGVRRRHRAARPVGRIRGGRPRPDRRHPRGGRIRHGSDAWLRSRPTAASRTCAATDRSASPMRPPTPAIRSRASATSAPERSPSRRARRPSQS